MPRRTAPARVLVPAALLTVLTVGGVPSTAAASDTMAPADTAAPPGTALTDESALFDEQVAPSDTASDAAHRPRAVSLFPSDRATVRDRSQLTGRRVDLPTAGCSNVITCGLLARINQLDGFDLDPRLALRFDRQVSVDDVIASTRLRAQGSAATIGIDRVVYDAATSTVYAHPARQLEPGTRYTIDVSRRHGLARARTRFTTLSATDGLLDLRRQLDGGAAYTAAGIAPGQRGVKIDAVVEAQGTTFSYLADKGPLGNRVPPKPGESPVVPSAVQAGTVVLGSYLAPSWLSADRTIAQVPTGQPGPEALGPRRLPFLLVLPPGPAPAGGWPTAVFGHGFTRSDADVLLAAATNAASGMATIATTVAGHGYGSGSTWSWTGPAGSGTAPAYGRGVDVDADGTITSTEGSGTLTTGPAAAVGSRDGLRQTAADVMTLVRAVGRGVDVDGIAGSELRPTEVTYFGQSFGGIYGTMVAGVDDAVARSVLNVPGGPINEIVRLSPVFRPLLLQSLKNAALVPADATAFSESLPLPGQPPVLSPAPGALAIQEYLAQATWLTRPGSPETFAPLVRPERALFQVAFGDQTVPNPTSYTLLAAGHLLDRASLFRNDLLPSAATNPHGFLLNPKDFPSGFAQAQAQVRAFLGDGVVIDPDGPAPVWEVPVQDPSVLKALNFAPPTTPATPSTPATPATPATPPTPPASTASKG